MNLYAGQDREALRGAWRAAWRRHLQRLPLAPLQAQMVDLIALHPEYQPQLAEADESTSRVPEDASANTDSYLHLALHMALREQLATDRPRGIAQIHRQLSGAVGDHHAAEHRMIAVLAQALREAQQAGRAPDEQQYLAALLRL